jgi:hypothetical protein
MKHLVLIWLACVALAWTALSAPLPDFRVLPDYMVENHCNPFSKSAVAMLKAKGIPAVRITFGWSRFGVGHGYHAAVLFKQGDKFYYMDNNRMGARPVAGTTDLGCVRHIDGTHDTMLWMTDEQMKRVEPRKLEELFR